MNLVFTKNLTNFLSDASWYIVKFVLFFALNFTYNLTLIIHLVISLADEILNALSLSRTDTSLSWVFLPNFLKYHTSTPWRLPSFHSLPLCPLSLQHSHISKLAQSGTMACATSSLHNKCTREGVRICTNPHDMSQSPGFSFCATAFHTGSHRSTQVNNYSAI